GPGNNGGDGLVAARELANFGARVAIYLTRARPDDDAEWVAVHETGLPVTAAEGDSGFEALEQLLGQAALVIDAVFGIGLRPAERPVDGAPREVLARLREARERPAPPQVL